MGWLIRDQRPRISNVMAVMCYGRRDVSRLYGLTGKNTKSNIRIPKLLHLLLVYMPDACALKDMPWIKTFVAVEADALHNISVGGEDLDGLG